MDYRTDPRDRDVLDVAGVGFGPSNLALAIAVKEYNEAGNNPRLRAAFLERQPRFGWHLGMMIEGATMRVSFLKDLVTLRNPTSSRSFVSYLHERNRLSDFINQKTFFPTRIEFHDYLEWSAEQVNDLVSYQREVTDIRPVRDSTGVTQYFDVESRGTTNGSDVSTLRSRNIVVATGLVPRIPPGVELSAQVWHSSLLQHRFAALVESPPRSIAVVGSGQSAAEVAAHLHDCLPDSQLYCVMQRYGYSPADDTPFNNRVFDPDAVDDFYTASLDTRRKLLCSQSNTNYSVVDEELITDLSRRVYQESVSGQQRLIMRTLRRIDGIESVPGGKACLRLSHLLTGDAERLYTDLVVLATGYQHMDPGPLLGEMNSECLRDEAGLLRVSRTYRVTTTTSVQGGIYLQGGTEHSHGLSSSLLSNTAVRAGEILDAVRQQAPVAVGT